MRSKLRLVAAYGWMAYVYMVVTSVTFLVIICLNAVHLMIVLHDTDQGLHRETDFKSSHHRQGTAVVR